MSRDADVKGSGGQPPRADAKDLLAGAYTQVYVVLKAGGGEGKGEDFSDDNEVFFRCGNWCYTGKVQFPGMEMTIAELPAIIPSLQKQQSSLRYYCTATTVPSSSVFSSPLQFQLDAVEYFADEMMSPEIDGELRKMAQIFPWIDSDTAQTYFEMSLNEVPTGMNRVALIASKTYTRGLIIISMYHDGTMYFVVQSGEGDQPLLDVRFPDVSKHNQGLLLQSYNNPFVPWRKLTLWHVLHYEAPRPVAAPKLRTLSVSSTNYTQSYCIMKSTWDSAAGTASVHHDALFRFGSWIYCGRVQLTPELTLSDIPYVIPALRMQQGRLDYYCDVAAVPTNSPFAACLSYVQRMEPLVEREIYDAEEALQDLIERLSSQGLEDTVATWLDGDPANSFFEFKLAPWTQGNDPLKGIELVATKTYHPSGVVTITIYFMNTIYVCVLDGGKENPLLDSRFPDVSGKGRGYQIQTYDHGQRDWPEIRKVSIWQTVSALEAEFRGHAAAAAAQAQAKGTPPLSVSSDRHLHLSGDSLGDDDSVGDSRHVRKKLFPSESTPVLSLAEAGAKGRDRNRDRGDGRCSPLSSSRQEDSDVAAAGTSSFPYRQVVVPEVAEDKGERDRERLSALGPGTVTRSGAKGSPVVAPGAVHVDEDDDDDIDDKASVRANVGTVGMSRQTSLNSLSNLYPSRQATADDGDGGGARMSTLLARPHHIPKMNDSLAARMQEIRKTMVDATGDGEGGGDAPWDARGRPLVGKGLSRAPLGQPSPLGAGEKK